MDQVLTDTAACAR